MSLEATEIAQIKPDVLAPVETAAKLENIGVAKAGMNLQKQIPLGIAAGLFIAMGGMMLALVLSDSTIPFIAQRLLGALSFCIGLVLVLLSGAELFTGNNLIINAVMSKKVTVGAFIKNLIIIWIMNLIGSLIAVAIVHFAGIGAMNGGAVGETFEKLAIMKVGIEPLTLFFKAILCNFLVCLAVWMSFAGRTFADKFLAVLFPITAFVAVGGEHSVANMFIIPMGYVHSLVAGTGSVEMTGILYNLGMVTVGNMVGGMVLVGLLYWVAFHKKAEKK